MEQQISKQRIEFIDLAKGVCIILVVLGHSGVSVAIPGLQSMRMPLYFILSGLFFKTYGSLTNLLIKKTNKLLIPFAFFYLTAYIIFYAVEWLAPGIISTGATGILDVFTQTQWFNGPIWFLLALFWCNLIFGLISINIKNEIYRALAVAGVAFGGVLLAVYDIFVPMNIHSAMTAMPFFYIGYLLKKTPLLYKNRYDKYNWLAVIVLYTLSLALELWWDNPRIGFHANNITGNYILAIIYSTIAVLTILMLCKMIGHLPFVSYFGRYSIIPLCLHHMVYRPVSVALQIFNIPNRGGYLVALITILICWACIPLFVKYLPYVTAQKDVIKSK